MRPVPGKGGEEVKIETKYEIGQQVFVKHDGEWWKGELMRISHNGIELYYEIEVSELYRYFAMTEAEIITEEPQELRDADKFLNLFPQFDQFEKAELSKLIRKLQKDAVKRSESANKKIESTP